MLRFWNVIIEQTISYVGTKNVASKTTETVVDGTKSAVNTTVDTTSKVVNTAWDGTKSTATSVAAGTKNLAAAGVEKTGQAWEGIGYRE